MANRPTNRGFSGTSGAGGLGARLVAQEVAELAARLTPDPAALKEEVEVGVGVGRDGLVAEVVDSGEVGHGLLHEPLQTVR